MVQEPWSQALLLLLETVEQQSNQLRRLEGIVAADAFGVDYDKTGTQHTPTSLAVSLARGIKDTKQDVQQLQHSCAVLQQQQELVLHAEKSTASQLQQLELRLQQVEQQQAAVHQQIGLSGRLGSVRSASPACMSSGCSSPALPGLPQHKDGLPATTTVHAQASLGARVLQLEQQVHSFTESAAHAQERAQAAASAVLVLDEKLNKQLSNIRTDTKQAIRVATSVVSQNLKADIHAEIDSKAGVRDQQLQQDLKGLFEQWEASLGSARAAIHSSCTTEIEARLSAAHASHQHRLDLLQQQLNRLAQEKADMRLLTQYTKQVNDVFEQLSATLVGSTQASIGELIAQQQELTNKVHGLSTTKADCSAVLQLQQQCQQQVEELHCAVAAAQHAAEEAQGIAAAAKRGLEPVVGLRLELADTQGAVTALQAAVAGLASSSDVYSCKLQDHSNQLRQLGSNHHMLQQQLIALTNRVDPAAAAVLAAAAAGIDDVTAVIGSVGRVDSHDEAEAGDTAQVSASNRDASLAQLLFEDSNTSVPAADSLEQQTSYVGRQPRCKQQSVVREDDCHNTAAKPEVAKGLVVGATRHLPLAMRLCLLESSLQELSRSLEAKAQAGDLAGLMAQVERLSSRMLAMSNTLQGVSSSNRRVEEQLVNVADSLTSAIEDRPSRAQIHHMMQQSLADAQQSATAAAVTAGQAAMAPLQQQMQEAWMELESAKGQLTVAQHELSKFREWQASLGNPQQAMQLQLQQLQQQLSQQWREDQSSLQQQLDNISRTAVSDAIKQLVTDQAASRSHTPVQLPDQVSAIDSKLKVLTDEIDRLDQQAAAATQVQGQHNNALAALETVITSHVSQCAAAADAQQQQRQHLQQQVQECQQTHDARLVAVESAAKDQATAVSELASIVAGLPSKEGIKEAVIAGTRATAEGMLQEHKQEEEQRWEVWLSEFARALELRPTNLQLEQQLGELQQKLEAAQDAVVTKAVAAAMDDGIVELDIRVDTLEEGLQCGVGCGSIVAGAAADTHTAAAVSGPGVAAGQLGVLQQCIGDVRQQLASLDSRLATIEGMKQEVQQQLRQQVCDRLAGLVDAIQVQDLVKQQVKDGQYVSKPELEIMLQKKLDIEAFLASVAARRCATS